ncbi:type II secretion system minor pseudopilin GspI [Desulfuromonas sp. AOP6]|uniref:type II secretion system minor pseudopilin GspI n=1 Tax=Desulfuromonas sp. AOP6 TaxID=1566351 RepID=UPI001283D57D|nr:type II secretion system minor pseudopilin GspI [Desulfuromonas sp. AOP6]BCA80381.1 hypothetical protein AOP6_2168 [Desulfuromonas sp. AOP6]
MKATWNSETGFTLLEVMIALAIVSVSLVTLLTLGNRSIAVHGRLQHTTQATLLAQQQMAQIEVEAEQGTLQVREDEAPFEEPFDGYRWQVTYSDTPLPSVKMVTVTVLWGEAARQESVELNSFIFD